MASKTLIDAQNDRILGFAAYGPEAGELMSTVQLGMLAGQPYTVLRDAMFAAPEYDGGPEGFVHGRAATAGGPG